MTPTKASLRWLLPEDRRCKANGIFPDRNSAEVLKPTWCEHRDQCARHVVLRREPWESLRTAHPRLCEVGEFTHLIALAPEEGAS